MEKYCLRSSFSKPALLKQLIKAKNLIDDDVTQRVDIETLASEASLSKFHFGRCFKDAFGISPYQYLLNKRLEKSVTLLKEGKWQVTEVAYEVGFADVYSFSRSFKKHFKKSPSQLMRVF